MSRQFTDIQQEFESVLTRLRSLRVRLGLPADPPSGLQPRGAADEGCDAATHRRIRQHWMQYGTLRFLDPAARRCLHRHLFHATDDDASTGRSLPPLCREAGLVDAAVAEALKARSPRRFVRLLESWTAAAGASEPDADVLEYADRFTRVLAGAHPPSWGTREVPYGQPTSVFRTCLKARQRWAFPDPERWFRKLGRQMADEPVRGSPAPAAGFAWLWCRRPLTFEHNLFERIIHDGIRAVGEEYAASVHNRFLRAVRCAPSRGSHLDRIANLLAWLARFVEARGAPSPRPGRTGHLPAPIRSALARALLGGWATLEGGGGAVPTTLPFPEEEEYQSIRDLLIAHLGLPEDRHSHWSPREVPTPVHHVFLRWRQREYLRLYFEIIATSLQSRDEATWRHRREFWEAYLNLPGRPVIHKIVPTLGPRARELVSGQQQYHQFFDKDRGGGQWRSLKSAGAEKSALLMEFQDERTGRLVRLVEWSHDGAFRLWFKRASELPWQLFDSPGHAIVEREVITRSATDPYIRHEQAHRTPARWRRAIARAIHQAAGIPHPWHCERCTDFSSRPRNCDTECPHRRRGSPR